MTLGDLLQAKGLGGEAVMVLRHRPSEPRFARMLPWLAAEKPELYNAYQQTQGERLEKALTRAAYVASFIGHVPGKAVFVGLYRVGPTRALTFDGFWQVPAYAEMKKLGMRGFTAENARQSILWFDMALTDLYSEWKGKLVVGWPPPERSWWRWAERNTFPVLAIHEDSSLEAGMPAWDELVFDWDELTALPGRWRAAISEWRGVYLIRDTSDGKLYVGAAYGSENLLGRWLHYGSSGHGGNRLLRQRDPRGFRFAILQRVSPDMDAAEVIRVEGTWKERLQTRHPYGLNDN